MTSLKNDLFRYILLKYNKRKTEWNVHKCKTWISNEYETLTKCFSFKWLCCQVLTKDVIVELGDIDTNHFW